MQGYLFRFLAGGFARLWTKTMEFGSESSAIEAARGLMRAEAEATSTRPLTMLVGVGKDDEHARWIGSWSSDPDEQWRI